MFLRRVGNKVLLLHSYRDGENRVRQQRLGQFDTLEQLSDAIGGTGWDEWRRGVQAAFTQTSAHWDELLLKAQRLAQSGFDKRVHHGRSRGPRADGQEAVARRAGELIRALTRCVSELESPEVRRQVAAELGDLRDQCLDRPAGGLLQAEQLVNQGRLEEARDELQRLLRQSARATHGSRRCFSPQDSAGKARLRALELLAEVLQRLNEGESAALQWRERVRSSPDAEAVAKYGACLQQLERLDEAAQQYRRLPNKDARRHFHLASAHWQGGNAELAVHALLHGLVRDRSVGEDLAMLQKGRPARGYWQRHSDLWSASGRRFFESVFKEPAVRWTLSRAAEKRRMPRQLLPRKTVGLLLEKALGSSGG